MDNERKFKGVWIPKEIWEEKSLSILEKVMLVEIDSLEDEEDGCYASNKYFANFFKLVALSLIYRLNKSSAFLYKFTFMLSILPA